LKEMGAELVGVPSAQAPNAFMEVTPFTLAHSKLRGSIASSAQIFLPDAPSATVFPVDFPLTWEIAKKYDFDDDASVRYALDLSRAVHQRAVACGVSMDRGVYALARVRAIPCARWDDTLFSRGFAPRAHHGLEPRRALANASRPPLAALSSLRGQSPAHEMRCPAVGKRLMSRPISDTITCAERSFTPGKRKSSRFEPTSASIKTIASRSSSCRSRRGRRWRHELGREHVVGSVG
jgi:hypothetical protein